MDAWTKAVANDPNSHWFLTEAQRNQYYATGKIDNMLSANWNVAKGTIDAFEPDGQTTTTRTFLPHGTIVFMNRTGEALRRLEGPTADLDAPRGHIGRFAKSWTSPDPSGQQFLIEDRTLPIIEKPDQFATLKVASDTWINAQKIKGL